MSTNGRMLLPNPPRRVKNAVKPKAKNYLYSKVKQTTMSVRKMPTVGLNSGLPSATSSVVYSGLKNSATVEKNLICNRIS